MSDNGRNKRNAGVDELLDKLNGLLVNIAKYRKNGDYVSALDEQNTLFNTGRQIGTALERERDMKDVPFVTLAVKSIVKFGEKGKEKMFVKLLQPTKPEDICFHSVGSFANGIAVFNSANPGINSAHLMDMCGGTFEAIADVKMLADANVR